LQPPILRVASYNIHKGVQGLGPARRLEIHNLRAAVSQFDADIVCLQEVRKMHRLEEAHFSQWPIEPQADFLAPEGYEAVYRTNAITRHGEHGNALLTRWPVVRHQHQDMSDHRFEQRGLLHVELAIGARVLHVIVAHFGLIPSSRRRQAAHICEFVRSEIPADEPVIVAGDFNDWGSQVRHVFRASGLHSHDSHARALTYPSILPVVQLDYVYARGLVPLDVEVPRGKTWQRMSDHLPLVAELGWPQTSDRSPAIAR
jgi:endonuclease/exonuclease/phosphatase family metal-dependent hydrolase